MAEKCRNATIGATSVCSVCRSFDNVERFAPAPCGFFRFESGSNAARREICRCVKEAPAGCPAGRRSTGPVMDRNVAGDWARGPLTPTKGSIGRQADSGQIDRATQKKRHARRVDAVQKTVMRRTFAPTAWSVSAREASQVRYSPYSSTPDAGRSDASGAGRGAFASKTSEMPVSGH